VDERVSRLRPSADDRRDKADMKGAVGVVGWMNAVPGIARLE
jgi:hypothetical protein